MSLQYVHPTAMTEENSTIFAANTPPETMADEILDTLDPLSDPKPSPSSVPWPGATFLIRDSDSGRLVTLLDGHVVLAQPDGRGSIHWDCVETKGWLGFRNRVSGRYLGHDKNGQLRCSAARQLGWENFEARLRPEGGYVLLMTHFERLWHVGNRPENGRPTLAKLADGGSDGIIWEFVKISQ